MVKSKKLLSLFLAVVMGLSVFTVMASAYTMTGAVVDGNINVKYTVAKVDSVPETAAGSAAWAADNLYAVTVWMQSVQGVPTFTAPVHYNKALFAPVMLSDGECTYPVGAGLDQDTYATDMGESAVYAYSLGDYMNNTGMYKADGSNATTKALAKCIGLGNANSAGIDVIAELVSPDHALYNKWGAGLPENTGVLYVNLDVASKTKTAYLNTVEGITPSADWVNMFTFYFETLPGVSDADVIGEEFGVYTADCFTVDGCTDEKAGYFTGATTAIIANPEKNVVSNAVIEEAKEPSPVYAKGSQIRFNGTEADGAKANFDVRTRAALTTADFNTICGSEDNAKALATAGKLQVGFVYTAGTMDVATAKAVATGTAADGYYNKTVTYIQSTGSEYVWTCLITNADYAGAVQALGYIIVDGTAYYFDAASTTTFSSLYDVYYPQYAASLS